MIRGLIYLLYAIIVLLVVRMVGRSVARLFGAGSEVRHQVGSGTRSVAPPQLLSMDTVVSDEENAIAEFHEVRDSR